jgi:hypothetical protein
MGFEKGAEIHRLGSIKIEGVKSKKQNILFKISWGEK